MNSNFNISELISNLINNFDSYINNTSKLTKIVNEISCFDASYRNLKNTYKCRFRETNRIGQVGYVDEENNEILFNLTRTRIVSQRKIETNTESGLINFLGFREIFNSLVQPTDDDIILYQFLNYDNWKGHYEFFANYKLLPVEIVHTIFHENEHLVQNDFLDNIVSSLDYTRMQENIYMTFVCIYQKMFLELQNVNKLSDYKRDNVYFPIEIDAEYEAIKTFEIIDLNDEIKMQIISWKNFINRFKKVKTYKDFIKVIWTDYEYLSKIYKENFAEDNNIKSILSLLNNNKEQVFEKYKEIFEFWK